MEFCDPAPIPKEDLKIPKGAAWYEKLKPLPKQAFSEHILVAAGMSDKWPSTSTNVPVLLLYGQGRSVPILGLRACHPCTRMKSSGVRDKKIRDNIMYPMVDAFVAPPTTNEGAHVLNSPPRRAITPAGAEVIVLSS
ncbi:hypothetical protein Hanom_Chr09g00781031 [Helianthus anomalus]